MLRFGTDGMRGLANGELSPDLALAIGKAAARELGGTQSCFVVGRDTRLSGPMIQAALSAGLSSEGADVWDCGVLPTPGIAYLSQVEGVPGAVVSASHNPYFDNGLKLFQVGGRKLTDEVEARFEKTLHGFQSGETASGTLQGESIGTFIPFQHGRARYVDHLVTSVGEGALDGLRIVLDCAYGAAVTTAEESFTRAGARVIMMNTEPDGVNINRDCGSTHMDGLRRRVVEEHADLGFAFDGDADRVLAVDHEGTVRDGDHLLAALAIALRNAGSLAGNTLVVTVMANLGLKIAMRDAGIDVHETAVGDRYVLDALEVNSWSLGGEQSGHIILPAHATTGDGVLAGLLVASLMRRTGQSLADLTNVVRKLPQVLRNVRVADKSTSAQLPEVQRAIREAEELLGDSGRILLRPSGTEPLVRVMVEAPTAEQADEICERICRVLETNAT